MNIVFSLYKDNYNMGGCLQSYALVKFLNDNHFPAEQCSFVFCDTPPDAVGIKRKFILNMKWYGPIFIWNFIKYRTKWAFNKVVGLLLNVHDTHKLIDKYNIFLNSIPHTEKIYTASVLNKINCHDFFIVGSDQVWSPDYCLHNKNINSGFWLTFTDNNRKIAYGASPPISGFTKTQQSQIISALSSFKRVSVRESSGIKSLYNLFKENDIDIKSQKWFDNLQVVVDPVMLLPYKKWKPVLAKVSNLPKKYVFTYFLGKDKKFRKSVKSFCEYNQLSLINIPYVRNEFRYCDYGYADYDFLDAGPNEFLTLIEGAVYVFTDSFHACAFSSLFHTKFFVSDRTEKGNFVALNRITDFIKTYGFESSYIPEAELDDGFSSRVLSAKFDFDESDRRIAIERKKSMDFLKNALDIAD